MDHYLRNISNCVHRNRNAALLNTIKNMSKTLHYSIIHHGEAEAGIPPFTEEATVFLRYGFVSDESTEELDSLMKDAFSKFYDGAMVVREED